uniref:Uncharacterized protein n=1 Tax=Setaria italica TaxID=4555 RepID=K3YBI3_SETIT
MRYEIKNANRYICIIGTNIATYAYILKLYHHSNEIIHRVPNRLQTHSYIIALIHFSDLKIRH